MNPCRINQVLRAATAVSLVIGIFMFLSYAPPMAGPDGESLGEAFRIFYFHVPSAWVSFLALFLSFVASAVYLVKRTRRWDRIAAASTEVGWVFATIVIITGPLWAKAAWGAYWTWEPRLTSFLVLWLLYLSYLFLRLSIEDPSRRSRYCAILSIVAFLDVPLIFYSIKLWGSIGHPPPNYGFFRDPVIRTAVLTNTAAFTLTMIYLIRKRMEVDVDGE